MYVCADAAQIFMPSLSPTMQHGTIVKWYKQEGELSFLIVCLRRWFFCRFCANIFTVVSMYEHRERQSINRK